VANLFSNTASLSWVEGESEVKTYRLPESRHQRDFCVHCGSPMPGLNGSLLKVPAGCLDTDVTIKPKAHIFMASKANWDVELENVPKFDQYAE
jgi:hypothetical protein